jgi:hypothetical protein
VRAARGRPHGAVPGIGLALAAAGALLLPLALETRIKRASQPLAGAWKDMPVRPRGATLLGISFRTPQVEAFGLEGPATLQTLLAHRFQLIRLGAYWSRIEPRAGDFDTTELDWQIEAAERAGKQIILAVGAVKTFGYPEFFVPRHWLEQPLREGSLVRPTTHPGLLRGATQFITRVVSRYRNRDSIVAWQLEHEAVDPLGVEHTWRLGEQFVEKELEALRDADPSRPVMMNGFLPTSSVVRLSQWWRTRDQGDSLAVAARLADVVGIDYYPRHALGSLGPRTLYLAGADLPWQAASRERVFRFIRARGKRLMVSEGQAEPWEAMTTPPNPGRQAMYSCPPEKLVGNYNSAIGWSRPEDPIYAYLFWGAEYWVLRDRSGDPSYLQAFARILDQA